MGKHTPGPWSVEDRVERLVVWADGFHDEIASLSTVAEGVDEQDVLEAAEEEQQANAALITAAPELYAEYVALRAVLKREGWVPPRGFSFAKGDAAISKATPGATRDEGEK